eukprot:177182_1
MSSDAYLDYRLIFIAACSSSITLLLLNIIHRFQIDLFADSSHNIPSSDSLQTDDEKTDIPQMTESNALLFADMISPDFYIHSKSDTFFESDEYLNRIPFNNPNWHKTKIKLLIDTRYTEELHQMMLDNFDPKSFEPPSNPHLSEITTAMNRFNQWRRWSVQTPHVPGWRYRTIKDGMRVWTHALPGS